MKPMNFKELNVCEKQYLGQTHMKEVKRTEKIEEYLTKIKEENKRMGLKSPRPKLPDFEISSVDVPIFFSYDIFFYFDLIF